MPNWKVKARFLSSYDYLIVWDLGHSWFRIFTVWFIIASSAISWIGRSNILYLFILSLLKHIDNDDNQFISSFLITLSLLFIAAIKGHWNSKILLYPISRHKYKTLIYVFRILDFTFFLRQNSRKCLKSSTLNDEFLHRLREFLTSLQDL